MNKPSIKTGEKLSQVFIEKHLKYTFSYSSGPTSGICEVKVYKKETNEAESRYIYFKCYSEEDGGAHYVEDGYWSGYQDTVRWFDWRIIDFTDMQKKFIEDFEKAYVFRPPEPDWGFKERHEIFRNKWKNIDLGWSTFDNSPYFEKQLKGGYNSFPFPLYR